MNEPFLFDEMSLDPPKPKKGGKRSFQPVAPRVVDASHHPKPSQWTPPEIPTLNGERHIVLNCETNGFKWWRDHRPIGWAYWFPESGRRGYLPIRHIEGNVPIEQVHAWLRDLRDMHITNHNTRFDLHMARADGVDLVDGTGNTFGDTMHYAALLDDNRRRFRLDELSKDILGWDVHAPDDPLGGLPKGVESEADWWQLPSWAVAPYAIRNCEQVVRLLEEFTPQINDEDLDDVLALEQDVIPVVIEIEKNGVCLDMELLEKWRASARAELEHALWTARQATNVNIETPDSPKALEQIFHKLNLPITRTDKGNPSFTGAVMKATKHPVILGLDKAGDLASLLNKYLDKYWNTARHSDGWMRHNLHQLKAIKGDDDVVGTVSGRFSATGDRVTAEMRPDQMGTGGYNPQQAVAVEKQLERGFCPDYVLRKLFKTPPGYECTVAADMMQVEYRLFAHYAKMDAAFHMRPLQKMIGGKPVWVQGPLADFHALVAELLNNPRLNRKLVKNINFAKIYGAGLIKFAFMLGLITEEQFTALNVRRAQHDRSVWRDPLLHDADQINKLYMGMFPAIGPLLELASKTAQNRGYVCDFLGRRARLLSRFHSALNRIIQGGAATYNKRVLVEIYKERKSLGFLMQLTVHDEVTGALTERNNVYKLKRVLNRQYHEFRVPILWDVKTGANWGACK